METFLFLGFTLDDFITVKCILHVHWKKFLVENGQIRIVRFNFIGILIEITGILITIFLVKSTGILIFIRTIISIRILVISIRILVDLTRAYPFSQCIAVKLRDRISVPGIVGISTTRNPLRYIFWCVRVCVDFRAHPVYARGWVASSGIGHPVLRPFRCGYLPIPIPGH